MSRPQYVIGDALEPYEFGQVNATKVIAHLCNSYGGWGAGFVVSISKVWWQPEAYYKAWASHMKAAGPYPLPKGEIQPVWVEHDTYVVNMVTDDFRSGDYSALATCLENLEEFMTSLKNVPSPAEVHLPRIGAGIFGGEWDKIEGLVKDNIHGPVFVYSLPQTVYQEPEIVTAAKAKYPEVFSDS